MRRSRFSDGTIPHFPPPRNICATIVFDFSFLLLVGRGERLRFLRESRHCEKRFSILIELVYRIDRIDKLHLRAYDFHDPRYDNVSKNWYHSKRILR